MNEIQIFQNDMFGEVRTLQDENGKLLFSGSDVAKVLGYSIPSRAINTHCKGVTKMVVPTKGGMQDMIFIPEGDIYRLVIKSKLPLADKFESWIFDTVVPSVMKHGAYMTKEKVAEMLLNPDSMIELLQNLKQEQAKVTVLTDTVAVQNQKIEELQPKASYYDLVLNCKDLVSVTVIAKDFGWSAVKLNRFLQEQKIQFKQNDIWLLYQKYAEKGYTNTKISTYNGSDGNPRTKVHTHWTQKGRLFIYDLMKSNGFLPNVELEQIQLAQ